MDIYDVSKVLVEIKPYLEQLLEEAGNRCYSYGKTYMNVQDCETIDKVNELLEKIEELINEFND